MPEARGYSGRASASPTSEAEPGVDVGTVIASKYRVDRVIGKGGMGVVVAATQPALERTVAIKLVRTDCAHEPMAVERLLREARAAASIKSEHVARVLDVGTLDDGAPFIVMEYLEGRDLQTLLEQDGPLPVADAVDLVLEACEALAEAHRNGIVHRDIKPANLILARLPGGATTVKVVDFGISKLIRPDPEPALTMPATIVGSLFHMAPEQMRGVPVDARTDVWALGLLLFELVTGKKPFVEQAWPAVCAQVLHGTTPLIEGPVPGVSDELVSIIAKCVRREPQERFGNVAELAVALNRFGTRRGHASLERIVLLATSTGSLAAIDAGAMARAMEPTEAVDGTRPVPLPSARHATPSTPPPVSSAADEPPARAPLVLAALVGLAAFGGTLLWLLPGGRDTAREEVAPLQPGAPAAPVLAPAEEARPRGPSVAPLLTPPMDDTPQRAQSAPRTPNATSANVPAGNGASPNPAAIPAPASPAAPAATAAAGNPAPAGGPSANTPGAHAPTANTPSTNAPSTRAEPASGAAPAGPAPHETASAGTPAPSAGAGGGPNAASGPDGAGGTGGAAAEKPASPPSNATPTPSQNAPRPSRSASPWDLNDIEFRDDARR